MQRFNTHIVLKISVLQSGKILADGVEISLDDLNARLSQIKSQNGVVWYYREAAQGKAPPVATEVIKTILNQALPISLSSKPDFSDAIDERGISRPRK
jgi:hypothetical protein